MKPLINVDEVTLTSKTHGQIFASRTGQIGPAIGMRQFGCRLVVLPPGRRAWPFHAHHANEEMFVVLAGIGTLRLGTETHAVRAGDVIACPAGGAETAHQLVNTGADELRYLAISTMRAPDVCEYPDSGKVLAVCGAAPGGDLAQRTLELCVRRESEVDYWEGE
jgi:uncharacterized cupin superfamily protein